MIWAKVVSWPWPWLWTPSRARTLPVGWTRISHESNILMPRMSKSWDGPAPTISVKLLIPMPISSPRCALLGLLLAQALVVDEVHRLPEGGRVVARVVRPAGRRGVRELLGLDEVLHPELGRVLADVVGEDVDHPLDRVDGLRHPERAAVGDAARRLVRVDAVDLDERVLEVVRAGDHVEEAGRELRRIGRRIGVAVVGDRPDLEARDLAVLRRAHLGVDVVVASERVGLEVLRAVLDPLDRLADQERRGDGEDVPRIDGDLAAEPAADVVGLHPDVLLGDRQAGSRRDERDDRPDRVRRLAGHVQRELLADRVPVGDAAAGLDRGDVDPRDVDVLARPSPRPRRAPRRPSPRRPIPSARCGWSACPRRDPGGGRTRPPRGPCTGRR